MSTFFNKAAEILRVPYVGWPLLILFMLTLPWTVTILPIYQANNYTYYQLCLWLILVVIAVGLNLLTGLTGMISLGHSAIYALGAYTGAYFLVKISMPFPVALVGAALVGGLVGLLIGLPALRLSGPYLAVATFGLAIGLPELLANNQEFNSIFNDPNDLATKLGLVTVPRQGFIGFELKSDLGRYYYFLIIAAIAILLAMGIWRSRTGRAFRAIRDSETAAQAMGVSLGKYKVLAFALSGMFAGVAGAMYTALVGQIEAKDAQFSAVESVLFLTAIILGGLGTISGAAIGAAVLTILPELTKAVKGQIRDITGNSLENFESIFYGLIIILCIFYMPNGLVGAFKRLFGWLRGVKKDAVVIDKSLENSLPIPDDISMKA